MEVVERKKSKSPVRAKTPSHKTVRKTPHKVSKVTKRKKPADGEAVKTVMKKYITNNAPPELADDAKKLVDGRMSETELKEFLLKAKDVIKTSGLQSSFEPEVPSKEDRYMLRVIHDLLVGKDVKHQHNDVVTCIVQHLHAKTGGGHLEANKQSSLGLVSLITFILSFISASALFVFRNKPTKTQPSSIVSSTSSSAVSLSSSSSGPVMLESVPIPRTYSSTKTFWLLVVIVFIVMIGSLIGFGVHVDREQKRWSQFTRDDMDRESVEIILGVPEDEVIKRLSELYNLEPKKVADAVEQSKPPSNPGAVSVKVLSHKLNKTPAQIKTALKDLHHGRHRGGATPEERMREASELEERAKQIRAEAMTQQVGTPEEEETKKSQRIAMLMLMIGVMIIFIIILFNILFPMKSHHRPKPCGCDTFRGKNKRVVIQKQPRFM